MKLSIIAALSLNRVIGYHGSIPWHIPEDVRRFKLLTTGHTILMGRKTFESIGAPLPNRRSVVVTSHSIPGIESYASLQEAMLALRNEAVIFIIGGENIFRESLPLADELFFTIVKRQVEGDAFFPEYEDLVKSRFHLVDSTTTEEADYLHYQSIH